MRNKNKSIKLSILIGLIGDIAIAVLAYWLYHSPQAFSVSRYVAIEVLAAILMIIWPLLICLIVILKEKFNINKYSITWIVCGSLSFFIGIVFFAGIFTHGEAVRSNLFPDEMDSFMDFYNCLKYGFSPYQYATIYPPFISVVYGIITLFVPENIENVRSTQMGRIIYVAYSVIICSFLAYVVCSFKKGRQNEKICFVLLLFLTRPFLFALERGNSVILTLLFIMLFLKWYNSANFKLRICGYFALGLATGIKIAPFILVLLIVRRREYLNTIIVSIIAAVLFIAPFIFTDGNIWILAKNLSRTSSMFQGFTFFPDGSLKMIGYGCYVNFVNLMNFLGRYFNFNAFFIGKYLNIILLILGSSIVLIKKDMEEWKAVTILMGLMILFPGFSAIYNLIYMIPPLIFYINYYEEHHKPADGYLFLFIVMMIPFLKTKTLFPEDVFGVRIATLFEIVSVNLLIIILILASCYELCKSFKHRYLIIVVSILICFAGYQMYYKIQPSSVEAFYPMNFAGGKAQQGMTMHKGLYKYIKQNTSFNLNHEKIVQNGLTVALENDGDDVNKYDIYADNRLIKTGTIERHSRTVIFIEGSKLENGKKDKIEIIIKNKGSQPLTLHYVGKAKPLEKVAVSSYFNVNPLVKIESNMYLNNNSVGFCRDNGRIQMSSYTHFLFSGDSLKSGILFKYFVPPELLNANGGKEIVLDIYINYEKIKSISINSAGNHYAIVDQYPGVSIGQTNKVEFKLNAFYTNKQFEYNDDEIPRGIFVDYFGNIEQDDNNKNIINQKNENFILTPVGKYEWFYPEEAILGKNICIIYDKNKYPNHSLKLQVKFNEREEIREIENSKFGEIAAVVIPSIESDSLRKISAMSLKLIDAKENDIVFIKYAGPSVLKQDVKAEHFAVDCKDKKRKDEPECLKRTSGLYYDSETKTLRMDKKAEILLDNKYMENKNMEIVFSIPEGLPEYFEDKDKNLEVFLDNESIMTVPLKFGQQKIIVSKKLWKRVKPVSTLTLRSTLFDLSKRVRLPRGLRNRGVEISYIGVER